MYIFWIILSFFIIAYLSWRITGWIYNHSILKSIFDYPNLRSLHSKPTPYGGGLSISILALVSVLFLWQVNILSMDVALAILVGGSLVTIIGWIDDRLNCSRSIRIFFYLLASIWAVFWLLKADSMFLIDHIPLAIGLIAGLFWIINLYNFMDGSDGIVAVQTICTGFMVAILFLDMHEVGLAMFTFVVVASSVGFLIWNWPPARIFMGDVGSCMLGFMYGALVVESYLNNTLPLSVWLILLSVFICDTSLTLMMRVISGDKWYLAHKQHGYQRFIQMGNSHRKVNIYILIINLLILYPLSYLVYKFNHYQWLITTIVFILLISIWLLIQKQYKEYFRQASQ